MYRLVIFDMDGTLADTSLGILNSHRYAHKMMGKDNPTDADLEGVIGGPLLQTYKTRFGFTDVSAKRAVEFYRNYYQSHGIYEAVCYPDIPCLLNSLKSNGFQLAVATLKPEKFVKIMLANMGIIDCFSAIYGMDDNDERTKAQLVQMCTDSLGISKRETVLIGDSIYDMQGADKCGVSFIAVTYGFGFTVENVPKGVIFCNSPKEIPKALEEYSKHC